MKKVRRLQLEELKILSDFIALCMKYKLKYFALGGTLLGAVRHKGFIPWDDDIDVGMPRKHYEKLSHIISLQCSKRYLWNTYITDNECQLVFAKLGRTGDDDRVSIDVFPIDGAPSMRVLQMFHMVITGILKMSIGHKNGRNGYKQIIANIFALIPRKWLVRLYEAIVSIHTYERSSMVVNLGGAWGYTKEVVPKKWMGDGVMLRFENVQINAPIEWSSYLSHIYGDYMKLPPERERIGKHAMLNEVMSKSRNAKREDGGAK